PFLLATYSDPLPLHTFLHDALPIYNPQIILLGYDQGAIISVNGGQSWSSWYNQSTAQLYHVGVDNAFPYRLCSGQQESGSVCISDRKSTRLNSSHLGISYAVFCLKK